MSSKISITFNGRTEMITVDLDDDLQLLQYQILSLFNVEPQNAHIQGIDTTNNELSLRSLGFCNGGSYNLSTSPMSPPQSQSTPVDSQISRLIQDLQRAQLSQPKVQQPTAITPSTLEQAQFLQKIKGAIECANQYEDPFLQAKALSVIPVDELKARASRNPAALPDMRDEFIVQLLRWFKSEFFKWVNSPQCDSCNSNTSPCGAGQPTPEDLRYGANRIELYKCVKCQSLTRFPRYNAVEKLLETRRGRCGEWANCFTLMCRALGYQARYTMDWLDHVWTEVYSDSQKRWVHSDSCEAKWDGPLLYEQGWGKKLDYVISFSVQEVVDVTRRYVIDYNVALKRRVLVSEDWLAAVLQNINQTKINGMSSAESSFVLSRRSREIEELKNQQQRKLSETEKEGRISGSDAWKLSRGEGGQKPIQQLKSKMDELKMQCRNVCFDFNGFDSGGNSSICLIGHAAIVNKYLQLTDAKNDQTGAAWFKNKINIQNNFQMYFTFVIGPNRGADGFAFVIQDNSSTTIGEGGAGIGYAGIPKCISVEFDTYEGWDRAEDPNDNHISIHTRGVDKNSSHHRYSLGCSKYNLPRFSDGNPHHVIIRYFNGVLEVFLDDPSSAAVSCKVDIPKTIGGSTTAWVGFTAATGGINEFHRILEWKFESESDITCTTDVGNVDGGKLQLKYIPQKSPLVLDKVKYSDVLSKLVEFNNQLSDDQSAKLSKLEIEALRKLAEVLEKTSFYHASNVEIQQISILEKILSKWAPDKIFPAVDLLRLCLTHPSGIKIINSASPFAEFHSIFEKFLSLVQNNNSFPVWLVVLRFFTNSLAFEVTQKSMEPILDKLMNAITGSLSTMQKKALLVSLAHFLLNVSLLVKNNASMSSKLVQILVQIFDKDDKDETVIFPVLVALGTLALSNYANKSHIRSDGILGKYLAELVNSTNSQIQECAKELQIVIV